MSLNGWIEIGLSNPNIFANQSNPDIVIRTYDPSASNKIIIGNTSSNEASNRLGGIYVLNNNVGFKKVPLAGVDVDINGLYSTIDGRVASNLNVGYGNNAGFFQLRGDMLMINSGTCDMKAINSNNTFYFMYSNIERIKFTNGLGIYLNDNVHITNDVYATGFHMTSDSNYKDIIREIDTNNSDNLKNLSQLKTYDYMLKDTSPTINKNKIIRGFIAQQIQNVFPNAVEEVDNIIPLYNDYVRLENDKLCVVTKSNSNILTDFFDINDKIVLGDDKYTKNYIVDIIEVQHHYLLLSQSSVEKLNVDFSCDLYIHGKIGKMKTIDTNQILALCVSSLQELTKRLEALENQ